MTIKARNTLKEGSIRKNNLAIRRTKWEEKRAIIIENNWHLTNISYPKKFCKNNCAILEFRKLKHS